MPFAAIHYNSLALTQLQATLKLHIDPKGKFIETKILYLNHEFARFIGIEMYNYISSALDSVYSGLGEWFFKQTAFPDEKEQLEHYFNQPFCHAVPDAVKKHLVDKRVHLSQFILELIEKYELYKVDVLGFTSMFSQNSANISLARKVKELKPQTITIMGGPNCESPMGEAIAENVASIDYVFCGQAIRTFPNFISNCINSKHVKHSENGKKEYPQSRQFNKVIIDNDNSQFDFIEDGLLDYETFYESFERNIKSTKVKPAILFQTSRGCWWGGKRKCTFCGLNTTTHAYHAMDANTAIRQFKSLLGRKKNNCSSFQAVDNVMPKSYIRNVFPNFNIPRDVKIFYEVRADLSRNELQVMSDAGVSHVQVGIESLNTAVLKLLNKGTTVFQNLTFLMNCIHTGITPEWNLLIGVPGDSEEVYHSYIMNIPKFSHLPPPISVTPISFHRYSQYYQNQSRYGLNLKPLSFYKHCYPFSNDTISQMAYSFEDSNESSQFARLYDEWFDKLYEVLYQWQNLWYGASILRIPKLFIQKKEGKLFIIDSRQGTEMPYSLSVVAKQLLELLDEPRTESDIYHSLPHICRQDLAIELEEMIDNNMIYHEGRYLLSLVMPNKPKNPRIDAYRERRNAWKYYSSVYQQLKM
jgi:ribosomal peptide maturation radical SAM protein 1